MKGLQQLARLKVLHMTSANLVGRNANRGGSSLYLRLAPACAIEPQICFDAWLVQHAVILKTLASIELRRAGCPGETGRVV